MSGLCGQYHELKERISNIEANLEAKLTQQFKTALDMRLELEISDIKAEVTADIAVVRIEMNSRYDE